jgi:hypothetical protein
MIYNNGVHETVSLWNGLTVWLNGSGWMGKTPSFLFYTSTKPSAYPQQRSRSPVELVLGGSLSLRKDNLLQGYSASTNQWRSFPIVSWREVVCAELTIPYFYM